MKLEWDTAVYQQEISRVEPNLSLKTVEVNDVLPISSGWQQRRSILQN